MHSNPTSTTRKQNFKLLAAGTGALGIRMPDNKIALDLARALNRPITATSANPSARFSGGHDSYSAEEIIKQFENKKFQPEIIINAGNLPKRKPSTLIKIYQDQSIKILREGLVTKSQIKKTQCC